MCWLAYLKGRRIYSLFQACAPIVYPPALLPAAASGSAAATSRRGAGGCAFCGGAAEGGECGELLQFELAAGGLGLVHEGCAKWAPSVYEASCAALLSLPSLCLVYRI